MAGRTRIGQVVRLSRAYGRGAMRGVIRYMHSAGLRWRFIEAGSNEINQFARGGVDGLLVQVGPGAEERIRRMGVAAVNLSSVPKTHVIRTWAWTTSRCVRWLGSICWSGGLATSPGA